MWASSFKKRSSGRLISATELHAHPYTAPTMKTKSIVVLAGITLLAAGLVAATSRQATPATTPHAPHAPHASHAKHADEIKAVEQAAASFYSALNVFFTGDVGPMNQVWSHAEDVTYMGPGGGLQIGWAKVGDEWNRQAAMKLGGKVEPADMHVTVGGNLAFTVNYEKGSNIGPDGKPTTVSIRATNTFRLEGGNWKMIGHHTDLIPSLAK